MSSNKTYRAKVALIGHPSAPKLFNALTLAYGLCGSWEKIIVIGSSMRDGQYQHLGAYNTLSIAKDATPQRYTELLNICASCNKEVVIFSNLSDEWQYGVQYHLDSSYYEDVLKGHRMFFHILRLAPIHVIACLDTRNAYLQKDHEDKRKLSMEHIIQQPEAEKQFTIALRVDKRGHTQVLKDSSHIFATERHFKLGLHHGALLNDWCRDGDPVITKELQTRIGSCRNLSELYELLFESDIDDSDVLSAFTRRKLILDEDRKEPTLEIVPGGLI